MSGVLFDENRFLKKVEKVMIENPISEEILIDIIKIAGEYYRCGFKLREFLLEHLFSLKIVGGDLKDLKDLRLYKGGEYPKYILVSDKVYLKLDKIEVPILETIKEFVRIPQIERTWKERLFSLPWNPFKKFKIKPIPFSITKQKSVEYRKYRKVSEDKWIYEII